MRLPPRTLLAVLGLTLAGCEGPPGPAGETGPPGEQGDQGGQGDQGDQGDQGQGTWLAGAGLKVEILAAAIDAEGTATVDFLLTDAAAVPLDRRGLLTEGSVSASFVLAWLAEDGDGGPGAYTAYTTRTQTSPITGVSEIQASADAGGAFIEIDVREGRYRYTFGTTAEVGEPTLTHTVGVWASRTFRGEGHVANEVFHFVPGGAAVTTTREVVTNQVCESCHNQLAFHGGARRDVKLCVLCHSPQTVDPDTGNTVDFSVMIHRIHMGAGLPTVQAGMPYRIIGFGQSVHDYSDVHYPQEVAHCEKCHTGPQGDLWKTRPSPRACGSCHDDPAFAPHLAQGPSACKSCHPSSGSLPQPPAFIPQPIPAVHLSVLRDPLSPRLALEILDVTGTSPGQQPTITFRATVDGAPYAQTLNQLVAVLAGPNTDFTWRANTSNIAGAVTAVDAAEGIFSYTVPAGAALPVDASGSYTAMLYGRISHAGTPLPAYAPVKAFAVTDPEPVSRRVVVDSALCNNCHYDLQFHGRSRTNPAEACILCHNAGFNNVGRASQVANEQVVIESLQLGRMIHAVHAGTRLSQPYILYGNPGPSDGNPGGNPHDFSTLRFPGVLRDCTTCHVGDSYALPLSEHLAATQVLIRSCADADPADTSRCPSGDLQIDDTIVLAPATAVCTGCHDGPHTLAHAQVMTTILGVESCTTCHGPGKSYDVAAVHGLK